MTHIPSEGKFHLKVKKFGPISEASIDVRPLTLISGRSSTGKTYFSTLLYALHNLFGGFPRLPLNRFHFPEIMTHEILDLSDFTKSLIEYSVNNQRLPLNFKTFESLPDFVKNEIIFSELNSERFTRRFSISLANMFAIKSNSELRHLPHSNSELMAVNCRYTEAKQEIWSVEFNLQDSTIHSHFKLLDKIRLHEHSTKILSSIFNELASNPNQNHNTSSLAENFLKTLAHPIHHRCGTAHYLPATRSGLLQHFRALALMALKQYSSLESSRLLIPDIQIAFLLNLLATESTSDDFENSDGDRKSIIEISEELEHQLVGGKVQLASSHDEVFSDFEFSPYNIEKTLSLRQSSSMISEVSPIILTLRNSVKPSDLLIIEEPEAHLHPSAQISLVQCLAKLINCDVKVLMTTHSDWILRTLHNMVLRGEYNNAAKNPKQNSSHGIMAKDVGVWEFVEGKDKSGAVANEIKFEEDTFEPIDYINLDAELYNDGTLSRENIADIS